MKEIAKLLLVIVIIAIAARSANGEVQNVINYYNSNIDKLPAPMKFLLGDEKIVAFVTLKDGEKLVYRFETKDAKIVYSEIETNPESPWADSTEYMYVDETTIERIAKSDNPMAAFASEWGDAIRIEPKSFKSSIKYYFLDFGVKLIGFFTPKPEPVLKTIGELPIYYDFITCQSGEPVAGIKSSDELSRDKYDNISKNVTVIEQPTNDTCLPTSGTISLMHFNKTFPGLVSDPNQTLANLSKYTKNGTGTQNFIIAIADEISNKSRAKNFSITVYGNSTRNHTTKLVRGNFTNITWITVNGTGKPTAITPDYTIGEIAKGENVILSMYCTAPEKSFGHSVKVAAINSRKNDNGSRNIAFADPAFGEIVETTINQDGTFHHPAFDADCKTISIVSISAY